MLFNRPVKNVRTSCSRELLNADLDLIMLVLITKHSVVRTHLLS